MAFEAVTSNTLVGNMSAKAFALALNRAALAQSTPSTASAATASPVLTQATEKVRLTVAADGALASGETVAVRVTHVQPGAAAVTSALVTLDDASVDAAGSVEFDFDLALASGTVFGLDLVYTAGGTPNAPAMSYIVQAY